MQQRQGEVDAEDGELVVLAREILIAAQWVAVAARMFLRTWDANQPLCPCIGARHETSQTTRMFGTALCSQGHSSVMEQHGTVSA